MKKYQRDAIVGIERENERDETYRSKSNPQIDCERTPHNYHFIKPDDTYTAFINQRIKDLAPKRKIKDDAVLMCSFFVGASPEFFVGKDRDDIGAFFFECTEFFAERYGRENIISAVVHLDETTPHMHLNLMPVLDGRLCAKQLFDRKELRSIQTDLHNDVGKHWGLERGKEGSTAEHLDTVEFKLKKMKEAATKAERQADEAENRQAIAEKGADAAESRQVHAEEATQALEEKQKQLQQDTAPLQAAAEVLQEYSDGKRKLNKRDLPVIAAEAAKLKAENGQLEQQLEVSRRDQHDVFTLYQKTEREKQALKSDADVLRQIREHAPDKLREALAAAEQRKTAKHSTPFKGSENKWSK